MTKNIKIQCSGNENSEKSKNKLIFKNYLKFRNDKIKIENKFQYHNIVRLVNELCPVKKGFNRNCFYCGFIYFVTCTNQIYCSKNCKTTFHQFVSLKDKFTILKKYKKQHKQL